MHVGAITINKTRTIHRSLLLFIFNNTPRKNKCDSHGLYWPMLKKSVDDPVYSGPSICPFDTLIVTEYSK